MPVPYCNARSLVALSFLLSITSATFGAATASNPDEARVFGELVDYVDQTAHALGNCPSAIIVRRGGEVLFERYSDNPDGSAPLGPINENTVWPLFSMTKSYAAALLLNLEHDGLLSLDDPVAKFLPEFRTPGEGKFDRRDVKIRHVASHVSGVEFPEEAWTKTPPDLAAVRVVTPPGKVFNYTAQGMHILERTIEAAAGREFAELLHERILQPLRLDHTGYRYALDPEVPMLPTRRIEAGEDPALAYSFAQDGVHPHFGLYATARDASRFADVWLNRGTLAGRTYWSADRQVEVWKHHSTRPSDNGHYGLLWWIFEDEPGYVMSGAGAKATAVAPETGVAITVLRIPLEPSNGPFDFYADKLALVRFGKRIKQ